ncbi:MAG TPA: ABC transporter substrate binding protein [Nitrospirota bacterium]|nr:ABC transporter substrate binding protein [Nitrospirota bacterium]
MQTFANEVIVVENADLKPYREVLRGFKDMCGCDIREVNLQNGEGLEAIEDNSPKIIMAIGTTSFKKVQAIKDLPIIYTMVVPWEASAPLNQNISGVSMDISPETYIATIMKVFPKAKKIGLLYDPLNTAAFVEAASKAARAIGIELIPSAVNDPSMIPNAVNGLRGKMDVYWMLPDPSVVTPEIVDYLLNFSFQHNVPIFSFSRKYVEMGAIAALDIDPYDMGVQAAEIAKKILAGNSSAIRVYARKSTLSINAKVARKMGLKIADDILIQRNIVE